MPNGSDRGVGAERALGLVDFTLYPHLDNLDMPDTTLENISKWAAGIPVPTYELDDHSAIKVVDGVHGIVSTGRKSPSDSSSIQPIKCRD